jgi:deoxyinosine 3'endonuclease (endonuclease V)
MQSRIDREHEINMALLTMVGGVDVSFYPGTHDACATLVVLSFPELKVLCEVS